MARTITTNDIPDGQSAAIRGKISFAYVHELIEGQALIDRNKRMAAKNMFTIDVPHTLLEITNPQILVKNSNNLTPLERYLAESVYTSTTGSPKFTAVSKSRSLPAIAVPNPDGSYRYQQLEKSLDNGLDVTIIMKCSASKRGFNNYVGMDAVVLNEPLRYFEGSSGVSEEIRNLLGIEITGGVPQANPAPVAPATVASASVAQPAPVTTAPVATAPVVQQTAPVAQVAPVTPEPTQAGPTLDPNDPLMEFITPSALVN